MLSVSRPHHSPPLSFGQRPGTPHLIGGTPHLGWEIKREESERAARVRAYPTPPMSGSPRLPPEAVHEANERGERPLRHSGALVQDVYGDGTAQPTQPDAQRRLPPPAVVPIVFHHEPHRNPYASQRHPSEHIQQAHQYPSREPHHQMQDFYQQQQYAATAASSSEGGFSVTSRGSGPETQPFTSPKSQRKAKGHVASACVPCKRAHLRCDAQRPCSRCLSNGKEDACIDVQHKKRGRPRLRDDRDTRYDALRLPSYPDISVRRPLGVYPLGLAAQGGDDASLHHQFHRPLESPVSGALPIRQYGRPDEANIHATTTPAASQLEPVAFLTMGMEFSKASPTFLDALNNTSLAGRRLRDVVVSTDAEKILHLQNQLVDEQKRREPNYLPPILGGGPALQGLGFSTPEISQFVLTIQSKLTFIGTDGYARQLGFHLGLGKAGSIYFVVMLLAGHQNYNYPPTPTPASTFYSTSSTHRPPPAARGTDSAHFDPVRHRLSEGSLQMRPPLGLHAFGASDGTRTSPRPASLFPYDPSGSSSRHSAMSLGQTTYEPSRSQTPYSADVANRPSYQLAPIRAQSENRNTPVSQAWQREDRPGRLDIEGLIDRPQGTERSQQGP